MIYPPNYDLRPTRQAKTSPLGRQAYKRRMSVMPENPKKPSFTKYFALSLLLMATVSSRIGSAQSNALAAPMPPATGTSTHYDGVYRGNPRVQHNAMKVQDRGGYRIYDYTCPLAKNENGQPANSPNMIVQNGVASLTSCNKKCELTGAIDSRAGSALLKNTGPIVLPYNVFLQLQMHPDGTAQGQFDSGHCRYYFSWYKIR